MKRDFSFLLARESFVRGAEPAKGAVLHAAKRTLDIHEKAQKVNDIFLLSFAGQGFCRAPGPCQGRAFAARRSEPFTGSGRSATTGRAKERTCQAVALTHARRPFALSEGADGPRCPLRFDSISRCCIRVRGLRRPVKGPAVTGSAAWLLLLNNWTRCVFGLSGQQLFIHSVERLVRFAAEPKAMKQDGKFSGDCDDGALFCVLPATVCQLQSPSA